MLSVNLKYPIANYTPTYLRVGWVCILFWLLFTNLLFSQDAFYLQALEEKNSVKKLELLTKSINQNPTNEAYFERAWAHFDLKRYNATLKDFKSATEIKGTKTLTDIYCGMASAYYAIHNYPQALDYANQALKENAQNLYAYYWRGLTYYDLKKYPEAIQDFSELIKGIKDRAAFYYFRHLAYYGLTKYNEALADIETAIRLESKEKSYLERKIMTLNKLGRTEEADKLLSSNIVYDVNDPNSLFNVGQTYYSMGDYDRAANLHQQAADIYQLKIKTNPSQKKVFQNALYDCHIALGQDYESAQNYHKALKHFTTASNIIPENYLAWNRLGNLQCTSFQNWEVSTYYYDKCFRLNPTYPIGWVNFGYAYSKINKPWEAIRVYERATQLDSVESKGLLLNNLGFSYLEQKKYNLAHPTLIKAIETDPDLAMSHISLGEYYIEVKKIDEAIAKFNEALGMESINEHESAVAYYKRGLAYFLKKDWDKATIDFIKSVETEPDYIEPHEYLGIIYFDKNDLCQAQKFFHKALELDRKQKKKLAIKSRQYLLRITSMTKEPCQ